MPLVFIQASVVVNRLIAFRQGFYTLFAMLSLPTFAPNQNMPLLSQRENKRLFPEEAERLLRFLVQNRWQRLSSEYHDPLGMLFGNRARQWTAGWDIDRQALFLLVWETDSWQEKPVWSLYQNGALIFQEEDGFSKTRSPLLHQLLESEHLPFINEQALLAPLVDFQSEALSRKNAATVLMDTIRQRPEIFDILKAPLLQTLEAELKDTDWPVLEILKLHRVVHKVILVDLMRQCTEMELFKTQADATRLIQALNQLQTAFDYLTVNISGLFLPSLQAANNDLKAILTHGNWRIRLQGLSNRIKTNPWPPGTVAQDKPVIGKSVFNSAMITF